MILIHDTDLEIATNYIQMLHLGIFSVFNFLIAIMLGAINVTWIYIFVVPVITHRNSPKITNLQKLTVSSRHGTKYDESSVSLFYKNNLRTVSIIVPARNEERVIYRSLSSLLNQSYPNYEIIAIDDNSSDNTLKLMQKVKAEHCRSVKPLSEDELQDQPQQFVSELHSNKSPININNSSTEIAKGGKEILTLTVSLPTSVNTETNSNDKLKIISLKGKPKDWTAKTWASHQGFLHSKGEIIIFTDADTYYVDKDMIAKSISYLQSENLDALTGFPLIELKDFWSRVICPVWKLFGTVFGCNLSDINDPRSDAANLNGCFIVIGRKIFQDLGTYEAVRTV